MGQTEIAASTHEAISFLRPIIIMMGVIFFLASMAKNASREKQFDVAVTINSFLVSAIIIGTGLFVSNLILKTLDPNTLQTVTEQKVEKEKELTGEEKLKKLNAYRKGNQKNILLATKTETEHYINYLKKNDLDKVALK